VSTRHNAAVGLSETDTIGSQGRLSRHGTARVVTQGNPKGTHAAAEMGGQRSRHKTHVDVTIHASRFVGCSSTDRSPCSRNINSVTGSAISSRVSAHESDCTMTCAVPVMSRKDTSDDGLAKERDVTPFSSDVTCASSIGEGELQRASGFEQQQREGDYQCTRLYLCARAQ
jgi:hypothetical protein